jgi:hypothetical protein
MNPFIQQLLNTARNTAGKAFRSFEVQALRNMGPAVRRSTGLSAYSTGPITAAVKKDPSFLRAFPSAALALPGVKTSLGTAVALETANTAGRTGLTGAIEGGLNQIGPGLDRFFGAVTPKAVQDFGKSMEQNGWGALGGFVPGERTAASVSTPERAKGTQATLNGKPVYWTGSKYGWQSGPSALRAGLLGSEVVGDDAFAPASVARVIPPAAPVLTPAAPVLPPSTQDAATRAYQQELSRTAQLTAQNPELQRYEVARSAANNQEKINSVRDIKMQMWAKANPELAAMVQPGQSGFDAIYKQTGQVPTSTFNPLMERTFPSMSRGAGEYTTGPSPLVPQVDPALNPAGPTYALGEGPRLMNFSDEKVTPDMIKAYQEQLLKQAASR